MTNELKDALAGEAAAQKLLDDLAAKILGAEEALEKAQTDRKAAVQRAGRGEKVNVAKVIEAVASAEASIGFLTEARDVADAALQDARAKVEAALRAIAHERVLAANGRYDEAKASFNAASKARDTAWRESESAIHSAAADLDALRRIFSKEIAEAAA